MENEESVVIEFFLTSGLSNTVEYSVSKWDKIHRDLLNHWNGVTTAGAEWGMNFAHVTHYQVKK